MKNLIMLLQQILIMNLNIYRFNKLCKRKKKKRNQEKSKVRKENTRFKMKILVYKLNLNKERLVNYHKHQIITLR
jgi:hypothetical protein